MDKRTLGIALTALGIVSLLLALGLLGYNRWESRQGQIASAQALEQLQTALPTEGTRTPDTSEPEKTGPEEPETLEIFELEGDDYIGWISAPQYDRELPIMHMIQEDRLKKAPCLQSGSPITDDAVISGHNYKSHFLFLHTIAPGEEIFFTYLNGFRVEYTVTRCALVDPTDMDAVLRSGHDLVLYTCTSDGDNRWAVYCDRAG